MKVYHQFLFQGGSCRYKAPEILDEHSFCEIMDAFEWRMPYRISAIHSESNGYLNNLPCTRDYPILEVSLRELAIQPPQQPMLLKDKSRNITVPVLHKSDSFVLCGTEDGYSKFYLVDGSRFSLITHLQISPISLKEAAEYISRYHRHSSAPRFHKFSICLRVAGEPEPVGVAVAGTPKARYQNDGRTLELNRVCTDSRYANVCSRLYSQCVRAGRAMGYSRFLTYILPTENGSSLKAAGFQFDGIVPGSSHGWDRPSRKRTSADNVDRLRWILEAA